VLSAGATELLECLVAKAPVGIPRALVEQVVEYELAPLPMPAPYVGGLGVKADGLVLSIALTPALGHSPRATRGVLLRTSDQRRWCLEVTQVLGFITAEVSADALDPARPAWLRRARHPSGRTIIAVDVEVMAGELGGGAR